MRFSRRTGWNIEETDLARAHRQRLAAGLPIADLTASNPTRCGFDYPLSLLDALADPAALDYDPDPRGSSRAREAVARYYSRHGAPVSPDRLILTTSTSEAYSYLFKLLCDPGDEILVFQPSYPLFEFLADAEVVTLRSCPLLYDHGWQLDLAGLRSALTQRTRAIVLVHPNNPTGHFTRLEESRELAQLCREYDLALIVDEVFLDYPLSDPLSAAGPIPQSAVSSFASRNLDALVFVVSGISKIAGLPQMKSAWLAALGPSSREALARLEVLADTYLSVNAPVQCALPGWLVGSAAIQSQIAARTRENLAELDRQLAAQQAVNRLIVEGGWYAILRIPALRPDEETVRNLLDQGVWVHPGYFFGMGGSGWLVLSLLGASAEFARGLQILLNAFRVDEP
jgi:aspartate/methionine/tyrosine aminotransferase